MIASQYTKFLNIGFGAYVHQNLARLARKFRREFRFQTKLFDLDQQRHPHSQTFSILLPTLHSSLLTMMSGLLRHSNHPRQEGDEGNTQERPWARRNQERPSQTIACHPLTADSEYETSLLEVTFEVVTEKQIQGWSSQGAANKVVSYVQGAAVETIHNTICALPQDESTGRKPNTVVRLAQCVFSVTSSSSGELSYCEDASDSEPYCVSYQGSIKIFHQHDCAGEIDMAALLALEQGVGREPFSNSINKRLAALDNSVTAVRIVENQETVVDKEGVPVVAGISTEETPDAVFLTSKSVSATGYVVVTLAGLLVFVLFILLFLQKRRGPDRRSYDDEKSVDTDASEKSIANSNEQLEDAFELARRSSKTDIQPCTDPYCPVCLSNPDDIHLVTVPKEQGSLTPDTYKEYEAREECFEAVAMPQDQDPKRRRNPLRSFRRKKMFGLESVNFVRVASATPSVQSTHSSKSCEL